MHVIYTLFGRLTTMGFRDDLIRVKNDMCKIEYLQIHRV